MFNIVNYFVVENVNVNLDWFWDEVISEAKKYQLLGLCYLNEKPKK